MSQSPPEIPTVYAAFLHLTLWPCLSRDDRVDVLGDIAELRAVYLAESGGRGLTRYTWRQLLQFPAQLALRRRSVRTLPHRREDTVDSVVSDLRMAVRTLRRSPLLTFTVVAGASTTPELRTV